MKNKILKVTTTCLLSISLNACASTPNQTREPSMHSNLDEKIISIQSESRMPGLQISVTENGNEIFSYVKGVRAVEYKETVTANDQWHIGSCTKPMTAFLIGQLVDQKKLKWDTRLEEIVPKKQALHSSLKNITVAQLLTHSSGLADVMEPEGGKLWEKLFTNEQSAKIMRSKLVNGIFALPSRFAPGSKHEYSNSGYVVLGWIVEQIAKDSWENTISKQIFEKLEMKSCGFGSPGLENQTAPTQPWGHAVENGKVVSLKPGIQSDNPPALGPAGTVHCSANDWRKFLALFLNESPQEILSTQTLEKLKRKADEQGPYTFSSIGRMEREWAKGSVYAMAGSNTYNYAIVAVAPALNRIYTINTNIGDEKAEAGVTQILKELTQLK
jgi:D-alanyl-D-alanine carboxypeptidase